MRSYRFRHSTPVHPVALSEKMCFRRKKCRSQPSNFSAERVNDRVNEKAASIASQVRDKDSHLTPKASNGGVPMQDGLVPLPKDLEQDVDMALEN